jgi:hypothetical protein
MPRPDLTRVPEYYHNYISHVQEDDLNVALKKSGAELLAFLKSIPKEKYDYAYAEDKWTIKGIVQHIIDAERVFSYRALRFARKDTTQLPGFNENVFAANAKVDKRSWDDLLEELAAVNRSTELLFASFDNEQLESEGICNNNSVYVLGIGFICAGHTIHHQKVIEEKYLK